MVTKEDVEKAKAEYEKAEFLAEADANRPLAWVAAIHAWDKYIKLREAFKNGNQRTSRES
jgi:hypothetical protein